MMNGIPSPCSVAIASCAAAVGKEAEDLQVIDALHRRGIDAVHVAWDDPAVDWSTFRLTVIRSTWDYPRRRDAFLAWAEALPRVLNPSPILRWNTDKRYLEHFIKAGLPVIPTRFVEPGDPFELPGVPFVVKPAVSCGARDTARYASDDEAQAREHVRRLQAEGRTVMVQPYLAEIEANGEVAVIFIGGVYSHAICRGALLNAGQPAECVPLDVRPHEASPAEKRLAETVMAHVPGQASELLYGRVDLVPGPDGGLVILEVELTEPALFLGFSKGGVDRLADGIGTALARS
ncbi:MAG: hypothetical protein JNM56_11895 [Planctomycetia bacterium]|nr:hypothetical protein [Planctomycetia bacterium]